LIKIKWPVALAVLFFSLLGWYVVYTQAIVDILRRDAEQITSMFAVVQEAIQDTEPGAPETALYRLQEIVIRSGLPLVATEADGSVLYAENLPFDVDLGSEEGQAQVQRFIRRLNVEHRPIAGFQGTSVHFGDTPEVARLRWMPYLLASGLLITVLIGFLVIRYQRRAEQEKAWTAMARELAHQLGTPISSLQGWLELLRLPDSERPGSLGQGEVAEGIEGDLTRLERISRRFELIGTEPELESMDLRDVLQSLEEYLQARLPRLTKGVTLTLDVPKNLPAVMGNEVLLTWALENIVKNGVDALAGKGGRIEISARTGDPGWVNLRITDSGPGVPLEIRDKLFEPGITGKSGGWGVGLTLSRRIIEGGHKGHITLLDSVERGATFEIRLPAARA
jgi:signal transduction histidine kinase